MITILCSGSRGDVQPYIALAQELKKLGLEVRIATGRDFVSFVRGYDIDVYTIEVDRESVGLDPQVVKNAQKADNLWKMFRSFRQLREYGRAMVEKYHDACLGSDAIVYHPGLTIGHFMAKKLGIPGILASPFPLHKTNLWPSVVLYGKAPSIPFLNRLSYTMLQGMLWMASEGSLRTFWKDRYGKLPQDFRMPFEGSVNSRNPACISCSNFIFERPSDWSPHVYQQGYWVTEESAEYQPSSELLSFLNKGEKPVYIGFGSMFDRADLHRVGGLLIDALDRSGKRGVLGGMTGLTDLPDTVMTVDDVPHTWLFPRMAAVGHHGGAGTSAAGFSAGVPSFVVPFALDQFAWAQRAYDLGIGSKPLPYKKLTAQKLSEAILYACRPDTQERSREVGEQIRTENGVRDSAGVIAAALGSSRPPYSMIRTGD